MKVLKFGGTSVGSSDSLKIVKKIALKSVKKEPIILVVSALSKVTNILDRAASKASEGNDTYINEILIIEKKHLEIIRELIPIEFQSGAIAEFKSSLNYLEDILKGIFLVEEVTNKSKALVLSFGERFSSKIITHYIKSSFDSVKYWDSSKIISTKQEFIDAKLDKENTEVNLKNASADGFDLVVMPGFIASNSKGQITTLGRGGSDFTASIVASILKADKLEIWTDVNGMLTADPSIVKQASTLKQISFEEAMELSHFGAKVLYPPSIQPAYNNNISMSIRNTFDIDNPGTEIVKKSPNKTDITGLSAIKGIVLIDISGAGMVAIPGYASRVFGSLSEKNVNIVLITQASSEHSITIAINKEDENIAIMALRDEFKAELKSGNLKELIPQKDMAIIALVGENMKSKGGLSGRAFSAMGNNGVNIIAIAQGSSEKNISMVVSMDHLHKAMNVLHEEFFLSDYKKIHLYLAGVGNVGGSLIEQIKQQKEHLRKSQKVELVVVGIINSSKILINDEGINLDTYKEDLKNSLEPSNIETFLQEAKKLNKHNSVFVDNTSNESISKYYSKFLSAKISVTCSNKIAASSSYEQYKELKYLSKENRVSYLYEANVGAGLPIIDTISNLVSSGDKITKIEGVLSGSLSFIFDNYNGTTSFAEIVNQAKNEGYTEPDPRIDLSGKDVARKILILARESGFSLEPNEVSSKNFMPEKCVNSNDVSSFMSSLEEEEAHFKNLYEQATSKNEKLKIVGSFSQEGAAVELQSLNSDSPFSSLKGTDNMILIYTERYPENPMIIQGAGAGASVTSAGVFGDILRTMKS